MLRAVKSLDAVKPANDDQRVGIGIVRRAVQAPARQIAQSAGTDGSVIVGKILESNVYGWATTLERTSIAT